MLEYIEITALILILKKRIKLATTIMASPSTIFYRNIKRNFNATFCAPACRSASIIVVNFTVYIKNNNIAIRRQNRKRHTK